MPRVTITPLAHRRLATLLRRRGTILLGFACLVAGIGSSALAGDAVSQVIDARIAERLAADRIPAAPRSDDAEFLRRVSLDLVGCIPTPDEVRSFLADSNPDKRERLIDRLLADRRHAVHFAKTWRALLLPEADTDRQIRYFQPGFEAWLRESRERRQGFDVIVRELLTVPIVAADRPPQVVLRDMKAANPVAFIASKEADPGKLAAATTRIFAGVRLECAECHDHPFDSWSREQFWNQAAFFAGLKRHGRGPFAPLNEAIDQRTITIVNTETTVPVLFLDGQSPAAETPSSRAALAAWLTAKENPYFARAITNRVWGQMLGVGLVDPVDDFTAANPASHPELLEELAMAFRESGFDLDVLYRRICRSAAYQRTSRQTDASQNDRRQFARMNVKSMSGEQFYDSVMQAIGGDVGKEEDPGRRRFLDLFHAQEAGDEPQAAVRQALTLMNGQLVNQAADPETGVRLKAVADGPGDSRNKIETLYLATLGRLPSEADAVAVVAFVEEGGATERARRLGDVLWALLNTAEFQWNH